MWIFGYGSLLWYTDFPYLKAVPGCLKGFSRKFWQASPDHRGTPDRPGRTVTLIPDETGETWGIAYQVAQEHISEVRQYLDWREKAGYVTTKVLFYPHANGLIPFELDVYISPQTDQNQHYIGPQPVHEIAEQVVTCVGPSGTNIEYVLRLAHGMRKLNSHVYDPHLFEVEEAVLTLCKKKDIYDPVLSELNYIS